MDLKDFFNKLFKLKVDNDLYANHLVDVSDYNVFKAWEAITYNEVENYFRDTDPVFYSRFRREVQMILRVTLGTSLLIMAQNRANQLKRTSSVARTIPDEQLIYEEAKKLLLESSSSLDDSDPIRQKKGEK